MCRSRSCINSFAVVHRPEELPSACNDISAFLSFQYEKEQPTSRNGSIVGIWLDASIEGDLNIEESTIPASRESVGVGGIWSLYRLKPDAACRLILVDALLDIVPEAGKASAGFIPIFRHDQPTSEVHSEVDRLWRSLATGRES